MREHPFAELLPELYASDEELLGLIEVFERIYLQNERAIDCLPDALYNPDNTPDEFLDFLGSLVGLRNESHLFLPAQMRALIPAARRIQRKKGTRQALAELLCVYLESLCGHPVRPIIVEYHDWRSADMPAHVSSAYPELYGAESDFAVLLPPETCLQSAEEQARLKQLVGLYCPVVSSPHVLVLGQMAGWGYLGINTYL